MSSAETSILHPVETRSKSMQEYKSCQDGDANNSALMTEFPPSSEPTPTMQNYPAGSCNSYYGGPTPAGYADYTDRFSMGYQRMGPTITLTSHKIQFGCQQAPPPPSYGRQRSDEPVLRHDHCLLQPAQAKSWADTSVEHTPAPPTTSAPTKPNNRGRTTYSDAQIAELEGVFHSNPYPTAQTRQHLACKIDVPEGKVKIWFQNRRARAKKIKMGCGGGNWRTGHNESKTTDEHTNQNNNNMKSDCSKLSSIDSSSISINSLLPLPTKPIIAASKWPGSSCMHPWRAPYHPEASHSCRMHSHPQPYCSGHSGCSCAPTGPRNVKMWNWGSGNYMPQPCHSMYKPELDDYRNPAHNSWDSHCAFGNAPDIVTKTSKVRLNDSSISNGEENTSNTSKHENPHDTSASETEQMNTSERFSESAKIINPYDAETCSIAPTYNSHFYPGIMPQERRQAMEELSSPPPIRRLIFPFHTLTDVKSVKPEAGTMGSSPYPTVYTRPLTTPSESGYIVGPRGYQNPTSAQFNIQAIKIPDSYQPYPYLTTTSRYSDATQYNLESDGYNHAYHMASKWNPHCPETNSYHIPPAAVDDENRQNSLNDQDKAVSDDGEATDDAVDEVGMMEGDKQDERAQDVKSFCYDTEGSQNFSADCWTNRPSTSSILVKAMEFATNEGVDTKDGVEDSNENRISGLASDVIPPVDSSAVWSNQLINGMYPSVSASMVG